MGQLSNKRHEALALGLADGLSQVDACIKAGYGAKSAKENASSILKRNPKIRIRVNEILDGREAARREIERELIASRMYDREYVIREAGRMVERHKQMVPAYTPDGKPIMVVGPDGDFIHAKRYLDATAVARGLVIIMDAQGFKSAKLTHEHALPLGMTPEVARLVLTEIERLTTDKGRVIDHDDSSHMDQQLIARSASSTEGTS